MAQVRLPFEAQDRQAFIGRQGARRTVQQGKRSELDLVIHEIEELERRLSLLKRRVSRLGGSGVAGKENNEGETVLPRRPADRTVSISDTLRIAVVLLGGRGSYEQLTLAARRLSNYPAKAISSVPAKLVEQGELTRLLGPGGHPSYEVVDMLKLLGKVKRSQPAYELLKTMLRETKGIGELVSLRLISAYGWKTKSFLLSDFVQTLRNVTDEELSSLIIATLPPVLSELNAKGIVELTEGIDGFLIRGKPISRISWRSQGAA